MRSGAASHIEGRREMASLSNEERLKMVKSNLIDRGSVSLLNQILVKLQSQTPSVISEWEAKEVQQGTKMLQNQWMSLLTMLQNKGDKACGIMLRLFKELDYYLYEDLMKGERTCGHNYMEDPMSGLTSILLPDLQCLICKEVFRDPVCIPCGHSYCKTCVKSHWMEPIQEGVFVCPQCSRPYSTCPELNINEVADRMLNKVLGSNYHQAKPENVTCKFCTVTYCEKHKQHYTVPALQKHRPKGSIDSEKENNTLSTGSEVSTQHPVLNSTSSSLESPVAGTVPQKMTTPTQMTSGTSQCCSHDHDARRLMKKRKIESPNHLQTSAKTAQRTLDFNNDQEESEAKRSSYIHAFKLREMGRQMGYGSPPDTCN